jgi:microcystin-dependent protein
VIDPTNGFVSEINTGSAKVPATTAMGFGASATGTMAANAVSAAGGSQPHENMQPYLAVTFIIALQGIYPSRS